ncbi:hypothetical protein P691DRAFT_466422 [Macrolepiota fuliginosa MF-IS2]|uniref:Fork-head domain-containing protein n=1 Tax=Macrolepiota fuliginosa MF-IS2 TaxID=1400762 RepID=A0A9P5XGD9_9AGAR|nr:hypothetical protein P691DRAFT_466422 [Macrolepiota fuliginosa MF-IS2]
MKIAIHESRKGRLTLRGILRALGDRFVYFRELGSSSWKNSIRRSLLLYDAHLRSVDVPEEGHKRKDAAPYNGGCLLWRYIWPKNKYRQNKSVTEIKRVAQKEPPKTAQRCRLILKCQAVINKANHRLTSAC